MMQRGVATGAVSALARCGLSGGLALALSCGASHAEEGLDPYALSLEQLFAATVVSTSRTEESLWNASAAVYVLTPADIARAGATSIPEALRLVPGVQVARTNASSWAISVRGFNDSLSNKLLVLIDGREVYDPLFSGVYWDVQDVALEDIERIEIVRGPGASLWGANAVNGVINVITKSAGDTQGLLLSAIAGDQERAVVTARFGGRGREVAHWRVYGKYFDRAAQETLTGGDPNDHWNAWRGGFRVDIDAGGADTFTLQGDAYHSESGRITTVPLLAPPYARIERDISNAEGGNLLLRWRRTLGEDSSLTTQVYYDLADRDRFALADQRRTLDIEAQYDLPERARNKLILGLRYRHTTDEAENTPVVQVAASPLEQTTVSGFFQDRIALAPGRWTLTLGSKLEHNEDTGFEYQPNVRLQWMDGERQTAWGSVSRAVRTPSELERDYTLLAGVIPPGASPLPVAFELVPNPRFQSEQLLAYELGYRRQWTPSLQADFAAFYNEYDGLATFALLPPLLASNPLRLVAPIAAENLTDAKTYGFEIVADWRAAETLSLSAAYSLINLELDGPPSNVALAPEAAEGRAPHDQFNLRARWDATDRLQLDATLYYASEAPTAQVDEYVRVDMRLGWRLTDALQVELVGQNLFDQSQREFAAPTAVNATEIQRSFFGRLVWRS